MKKQLKRIWWKHAGTILVVGAVVVVVFLVVIMVREERSMIDDCVATTGRDFYECRALVKAGSPRAPVIINPGRGY